MNIETRPIALDPRFFSSVWEGAKRSTIRRGRRDIRTGEALTLTDGLSNRVAVKVTDVWIKHLDELTESDARRDGFDSLQGLLIALAEFYPNVSPQDLVTIIGFTVEEGTFSNRL